MVKSCELCGSSHRNRSINRCNNCRFGNCQECGCLLDPRPRLPMCMNCWIKSQQPRGRCLC